MGFVGRDERADLGQDRDQRILAQERRFAGHVRAGNQPKPPVGVQIAVIGNELRRGIVFQECLDHRVTTADDLERGTVIDDRPDIAAFDREPGQRRGDIDLAQRRCGTGHGLGGGDDACDKAVIDLQLACQRLVRGTGQPLFKLAELDGSEALGIAHRLTVYEPLAVGDARGIGRRHLDEIAQNIVVPDLERGDPGFRGIARL